MRPEKLLIDANLLVLLVVGMYDGKKIENHKRLKSNGGFTEGDFETLNKIIADYSGIVLTPHTLAEMYDLCSFMKGNDRIGVMTNIAILIDECKESFVTGKIAAREPEYVRLGLVDAILLRLASKSKGRKPVLLTIDLDLHRAALAAGHHKAINFNHYRNA